jgi:hypothetical protein
VIVMRFTCDHDGCTRHFDADAVLGASTTGEVMVPNELTTPPREVVRLDSVVVLPEGWSAWQKAERYVPFVYCAEHATDARQR